MPRTPSCFVSSIGASSTSRVTHLSRRPSHGKRILAFYWNEGERADAGAVHPYFCFARNGRYRQAVEEDFPEHRPHGPGVEDHLRAR